MGKGMTLKLSELQVLKEVLMKLPELDKKG